MHQERRAQMIPYRRDTATDVRRTPELRIAIMKAMRTLAAQEEDEHLRRRRAEIAALRRELEEIAHDIRELCRKWALEARLRVAMPRDRAGKAAVDDPKHAGWPAGAPDRQGGRFRPKDSDVAAADQPAADAKTRATAGRLSARDIPADHPKHPVPLVDSRGNPVTDDQGNPILRPADLPPEMYVSGGAASNLGEYILLYNQALQNELNAPAEQNEVALAGLAAKIAAELSQFRQGGSLDAERVDGQYLGDYRDYANIAIGLYLAAAGVTIDDGLSIADSYAQVMSDFHEPMDEVYTDLPKRDVSDIKMGYELYQSGRILAW